VWSPMWTLVSAGVSTGLAGLLQLTRFRSVWRWACAVLLFGYIVLNRGFAYTSLTIEGVPIYVGELTLFFCLLAMPHRASLAEFMASAPARWMFGWLLIGITLTIPGFLSYGVPALRDAAVYYYVIFTYIGYAFAEREQDSERLLRVLGVAFLFHLVYNIVYFSGVVDLEAGSMSAPGSDFPLFSHRGDASSTAALAGALFMLLVSRRSWASWLAGLAQLALFVGLHVRAGYAGFALVAGLLVYAGRLQQILRVFVLVVCLLLVGVGLDSLLGLREWGLFPTRSGGLSPERLVETVQSIFDVSGQRTYRYSDSEVSQSNVQWRLEFWQLVLADTLGSARSFLVGGGFGQPLVGEPKFFKGDTPDRPTRSPHNIALTVLGRMGIVGLGLWAGFLLASYRHILRGVRASGRLADSRFHERLTFVSAYTLAVFGAALFGVLLESPFGAIPYYFLLGLAIKWAERRPAVGEVEDLVASQSEG